MLSLITAYAAFFFALGCGVSGGLLGCCGLCSLSGGGDVVGRTNFLSAMMSVQLVVLPSDSGVLQSGLSQNSSRGYATATVDGMDWRRGHVERVGEAGSRGLVSGVGEHGQ